MRAPTERSLLRERDAIRRAELRGGSRLTARRRAYNDGVRRLRLRGGVGEKRKDPPSVDFFDAIADGDVRAVERLLAAGADPNKANVQGETPLIVAIQGREVSGYISNEQNRYISTQQKQERKAGVVELLLARGADPNNEPLTRLGHTPLMLAILKHNASVVELLLAHGADPNKRRDHGCYTPLMIALQTPLIYRPRYQNIVKLLVRHGADIMTLENDSGETALDIANFWKEDGGLSKGMYDVDGVIEFLKKAQRELDKGRARRDMRVLSGRVEKDGVKLPSLPGDYSMASHITGFLYDISAQDEKDNILVNEEWDERYRKDD